jgi:hypothetical protein
MKPRFIVDFNVGRLAKWLRVLGYDTLFLPGVEDSELVRIALKEDRVILTKDSRFMSLRLVTSGRLRVVFIQHDDLKSQLQQVVQELKLDASGDFSLCIRCNQPLAPIPKEEVRERVPPYVFQTQEQFMVCQSCQRIYWRGTHWANMRRELSGLKGEEL